MFKRYNGSQIAPCIISKVKNALNVENRYEANSKKCTREYWEEVVTIIGDKYSMNWEQKEKAKDKYKKYM